SSGAAGTGEKPHMIVSAIEHAAIHAQSEVLARMGFSVSYVKPDSDGIISPQKVAGELRPSTKLVAIMAVNNETGAIQDVSAIGSAIASASDARKMRPPLFHIDCVQALGKIPLDIPASQATSAAFSAHKLRGPKGIGALWYSKTPEPLALGGGQEMGLRSGTENLFGASAFATCAAKAIASMDQSFAHACSLEKELIEGLHKIKGACVVPQSRTGRDTRWSPWIVSAAFPGLAGEVFARALSDAGICVSTGSACSHAGKTKGRRILDAMGLPEELSFSAIRISIGPTSTKQDIDTFLGAADDLYRRLKT
ncbi:MAG TPA: aminotransferase class V-fold PLP-dependent enzyme, partial [Rectinemataceae bacterium]|nr:aminotransferase class V-fold PLP-dependent enzyme [Rectinemataceae bacterium]